jgi:hypothetical protein
MSHSIAVAELEPILFVVLLCCHPFVLTDVDRYSSLFQQGSIGCGKVFVALEELTSYRDGGFATLA